MAETCNWNFRQSTFNLRRELALKPTELAALRDFLSKKYRVPPPKIGLDFNKEPHCCLTKNHPFGEGTHMDGFYEHGSGVLNVRWNSKDPMDTLAHEFNHYLRDLDGLEDSEDSIDLQAAGDLAEYRAANC